MIFQATKNYQINILATILFMGLVPLLSVSFVDIFGVLGSWRWVFYTGPTTSKLFQKIIKESSTGFILNRFYCIWRSSCWVQPSFSLFQGWLWSFLCFLAVTILENSTGKIACPCVPLILFFTYYMELLSSFWCFACNTRP